MTTENFREIYEAVKNLDLFTACMIGESIVEKYPADRNTERFKEWLNISRFTVDIKSDNYGEMNSDNELDIKGSVAQLIYYTQNKNI
jgi:hypothetical protein